MVGDCGSCHKVSTQSNQKSEIIISIFNNLKKSNLSNDDTRQPVVKTDMTRCHCVDR